MFSAQLKVLSRATISTSRVKVSKDLHRSDGKYVDTGNRRRELLTAVAGSVDIVHTAVEQCFLWRLMNLFDLIRTVSSQFGVRTLIQRLRIYSSAEFCNTF